MTTTTAHSKWWIKPQPEACEDCPVVRYLAEHGARFQHGMVGAGWTLMGPGANHTQRRLSYESCATPMGALRSAMERQP